MLNINEIILDRVRSLTYHDLGTTEMICRLTSIEEPSLNTTADENEEVVDAIGSVITTLYRAKRATFSGSNSLISMDLAALQYGTKKEVASTDSKLTDYTYEIITIPSDATNVSLKRKADDDSIKYIYTVENKQVGTSYKIGTAVSATEFTVDNTGDVTVINLPTGLTGRIYVEYTYQSSEAVKVSNYASNFPEAGSLIIYAYFKDVCNENLVYSGKILCPKAKLNPESIELALTSTGKHPFEFTMMKDYCAEEGEDELFTILISNETISN